MKRLTAVIFAGIFVMSLASCGKKGPMKGAIVDRNCSLSIEKKSNRIIGGFKGLSTKSKRIDLTLNGKPFTVYYTDDTEWKYSSDVTEVWHLRKHKGRCLAFDYEKKGSKFIAKRAIVAEEFEVDKDLVIGYDEFMKLKDSAVLVDNRPGWKAAEGTIPGSIIMPPKLISNKKKFQELLPDKNKPVIFFCGGFT